MSQRFSLYEDLKVEENLEFFGGVQDLEAGRLEMRKSWALEVARLGPYRGAITGTLSGGVRQRLALDRGPDRSRLLARQWRVLVHRNGSSPAGTGRWLDARRVEGYAHVRLRESADFDRAARLLTRRGIGLTLGGGFARGIAHLGIFRAMAEPGVAVDAVGGASMGAMIAALWALGWDAERILREVTAACAGAFGDLTFPFLAFKRGGKFSSAVRSLFGDVQIEDLWIPYFCISANLNRAELKVHTRGSLAKALLAATRAPGVFPPVIYEGELHVDGGVVNNVPVDLMRSFSNDGNVSA